jgi:hypothetical protein
VRDSGAPVGHDGALALREYDIGYEVSVSNGVYVVKIDTSFKNLKSCEIMCTIIRHINFTILNYNKKKIVSISFEMDRLSCPIFCIKFTS